MTTHKFANIKIKLFQNIYCDHLVKINKQVNFYIVKYDQIGHIHNTQYITAQFNYACKWLQFRRLKTFRFEP